MCWLLPALQVLFIEVIVFLRSVLLWACEVAHQCDLGCVWLPWCGGIVGVVVLVCGGVIVVCASLCVGEL